MSSDETLNCVLCKEVFTDKETLQEHFRKHGDRNFDQTTKLQKLKNEGENSDKINVNNEVVQCDVCEEVFPTISKAITHKHKSHPDHNTKYFCSWCGKLFTMKHLYNKHYINHENMERGEDVFHCDHCDVDFYKVAAMLYHNKSVHRESEIPDIGHSRKQKLMNQDLVVMYYCPFCGEENNNKVNVNKHISDDHSGEDQSPDEVLRCPLCDAIFYHLDAYEAHLTYHSPDDIYNGVENSGETPISEYSLDTVPPVVEKVEDVDEATTTVENLEMADEDSSEKRKHKKKHKKHKKSKKETITLDEFLSMSDVLGGEGLDIHGIELVPTQSLTKNFKTKPRPQLPKINKQHMSQIDKLKQQGIVVKKSNSQGTVLRPAPKMVPMAQANVTAKKSSAEVLSKLLNQSCSQLVISKKPAVIAKNIQDAHKDLSSPDLINKSHESLEVECDLLPCSSSDIDQNDAISDINNIEKDIANKPNNAALNLDTAVESNTTEIEQPEQKKSVPEETKKLNSLDMLKYLSHLITVKSVSKPEVENETKENTSRDNTIVPNSENTTATDENVSNTKEIMDKDKTENLSHISSQQEEMGSNTTSKKMDSMTVLRNVSQQITVKPVAKPNNKKIDSTEDVIDKNYLDKLDTKTEINYALSEKTSDPIVDKKLQSTFNQDGGNISIENKNSSNQQDILKGLGQNIVIKSSPKHSIIAVNTSNDLSMLEDDVENNIPDAVIVKKLTFTDNKTLEHDSKVKQPSNSTNNIPDLIKNLSRSITIKSNNSQNSTRTQLTHENSDIDKDCDDESNIKDDPTPKQNCSLNDTKPITKPTPIQQSGTVRRNDQAFANSLKNISQNITIKPSSLKSQNTDIDSIRPNSTVIRNPVGTKEEAVPAKNLEVIKNLSKHITVKSSKPLATSSENDEDNHTDEEENNLDTDPSPTSGLPDDTSTGKSVPQQHNKANQVVLQNISQEITIKQSSPKPQNTLDTKPLKKTSMVNRPVPNTNKIFDKSICKNTEIFSIDDSDSDDIDAKKSTNLPKNSGSKVDVMGYRSTSANVPPAECLKFKNISVKPVIKTEEVNNKALVVFNDNKHEDDFFDLDFDETEPEMNESLNNSKACETQKLLMKNKNITMKSSNSAQTNLIKNMSQKMVKVDVKSTTKMDEEFSEDEGNLDFPLDSDDDDANYKETVQNFKDVSNFGKEAVTNSFKDFDSDSNGFSHEDDGDDALEDESNSLINKLKNINKNLSIKSNNPTIPSTSKKNVEHNVLKRKVGNDSNSHSNTTPKQTRLDNSNKVENSKQANSAMQVSNNQIRAVNHQASTSSTNKVQQKVTTSVRRIETETVVEEITTTVTRTIKTVNQTVNKQLTMSGSQTNVVTEQPLRFVSPLMMSGPRPQQIRSIQGTRVRAPPPVVRPRMRPTRPILGNNVRLPTPSQRLPSAPRIRPTAPTANVAPGNTGSFNQPRATRPLRVSPNVIGQLNRANQSFSNTDERPGHFSCFRKPKEAVTPLNEIPDCLPGGFSSMVQESNFSNKKTIVKSDGAGTSQVRSEVSSSAHQQIKKVNMAGVKVAKRSMVQQVRTMEQCEVSSASKSTMDAIERLQRSGLLVKKPRIEEDKEEMNYNSEEEEVPHEGPLLAIEDGT